MRTKILYLHSAWRTRWGMRSGDLRIAVVAHLKYPIAEPFFGGLEMHTHLLVNKLAAWARGDFACGRRLAGDSSVRNRPADGPDERRLSISVEV